MADSKARTDHRFVDMELIETWKQDNVCFFCRKKSFKDKLKCEKCLEFEYCSIECLENDRAAHTAQCNLIGVRKGLRLMIQASVLKLITSRAKLLDLDGDIKDEIEVCKELEAIERLGLTVVNKMSVPIKNRLGKNKRKKRKKRKLKAKDSDVKSFCIKKLNVPLPVCGKFGGPVTCSRQELSGEDFGQGWWKTRSQTAPLGIKTTPSFYGASSDVKITNQDLAGMKFADFYSDTDEDVDTSREVYSNQKVLSKMSSGIFSQAEDKGSRNTEKPSTQDRSEWTCAAKHKQPKFNVVKEEAGKTKNKADIGSEKQCRKKTDAALGLLTCSFCGRKGDDLKTCSGCKKITYCNKECQIKDRKNHRSQCKRDQRFQKAVKNIPTAMLAAMCPGVSINPLALTFEPRLVGSAGHSILLEITQSNILLFAFCLLTVDLTGRKIFLSISLPRDTLYQKVNRKTGSTAMVPLHLCLSPGNFILVFDPQWYELFDGTPTFELFDQNSFYIVFADHFSTC